jgi:hypothetical protein
MPYSGKDAFAQRDGQERGRCQEVRCRDCKGPDRVHWNGGSLNNEAVLGGSKPPRPRSARRRNSNPQLSINSNAGGADRADLRCLGQGPRHGPIRPPARRLRCRAAFHFAAKSGGKIGLLTGEHFLRRQVLPVSARDRSVDARYHM